MKAVGVPRKLWMSPPDKHNAFVISFDLTALLTSISFWEKQPRVKEAGHHTFGMWREGTFDWRVCKLKKSKTLSH